MNIILILFFAILFIAFYKFIFINIVYIINKYTNGTGIIEKNLGGGNYIVRLYATPYIYANVTVHSENHSIHENNVVMIERNGIMSYRISCLVSYDKKYIDKDYSYDHMQYCNEVSKKIDKEENNGKA